MAFSRLRARYQEWKRNRDPHYRAQKERGERAREETRLQEEEERRRKEEFFNRTVSEIVPLDIATYLKDAEAGKRAFADRVVKEKGDVHARPDTYELFSFGDVPAKYFASAELKTVLSRHLDGFSKMKGVPLRAVRDALKNCEKELPSMEDMHYPVYELGEYENGANVIALELRKKAGIGLRWQGIYIQVGLVPVAEVHYG